MSDNGLTITMTVGNTPQEVYEAVTDVRGWWLDTVRGSAAKTGDEYDYEVPGVHRATIRVTEAVPFETITWTVLDNWFGFTDAGQEWTGTEIRFDIAERDGATELTFTHAGLMSEMDCYKVCEPSWDFYVGQSLRALITTGTGRPGTMPGQAEAMAAAAQNAGYQTEFWVDVPPDEVLATVGDPAAYWAPEGNYANGSVEGVAAREGDRFTYHDNDLHADFRVTEIEPGRRAVWAVVDSRLGFVRDSQEWTGSTVRFDLTPENGGTRLRFTHDGLTPAKECYGACSNGWHGVINDSLQGLLNGNPWRPGRQDAVSLAPGS